MRTALDTIRVVITSVAESWIDDPEFTDQEAKRDDMVENQAVDLVQDLAVKAIHEDVHIQETDDKNSITKWRREKK